MGAGPDQTDQVTANPAEWPRECCQVLELTRHPAIRMNPAKLPPLTAAMEERIRKHRAYWKGRGKISIVRRGQPAGCVCITVTEPHQTRRMFYYADGTLAKQLIERPLFADTAKPAEPQSALLLNTED